MAVRESGCVAGEAKVEVIHVRAAVSSDCRLRCLEHTRPRPHPQMICSAHELMALICAGSLLSTGTDLLLPQVP